MKFPELDYAPPPRVKRKYGIGIVGSGGIVRGAHLPAYRAAGLNVVAIAGRNALTVQQVGTEFGIPQVTTDYRALIENPAVEVVDIAIPGEGRLELVRAAALAGKHMLVQKPLANTLAEAVEMVQMARSAGVMLAVNQNARWAPVYRAARSLLQQGYLGEIFDVTHDMRNSQDSQPWFAERWYAREERYQIIQYSVHHLDILRFWMGREPSFIMAHNSRKPGQIARGEMLASIIADFGPTAQALICDRNACWPGRKVTTSFTIEGTEGSIEGDVLGGTLQVFHNDLPPGGWGPELSGQWFPDAFSSTMGELMNAIAGVSVLDASGADNLLTMALVEAAYRSAEQHCAVAPGDLLAETGWTN